MQVPANAAMRLMQHYVDNMRQLPWRAMPGAAAPDPYRVWLSEIMLQQTSVAAVAPRFERFLARWPTVAALAAAPDAEVLSEWAGLGYYARARNLIACARAVAERGGFPTTAAELRMLPGIGEYSAAAIAAIAFGERVVPVDTNVTRVIARVHGLERPARGEIARLAQVLLPPGYAGDFAQALFDLGATICRPRAPACPSCPLNAVCAAFASGSPERFPAPGERRARPHRYGVAHWIEQDGQVWLVRRPARGLLGGMAALPGSEWSDSAPAPAPGHLGTVRHVFTHFSLDLSIERRDRSSGAGWWHPIGELDDAGLPTLYRRAAQLAVSRPRDRAAALEVVWANP